MRNFVHEQYTIVINHFKVFVCFDLNVCGTRAFWLRITGTKEYATGNGSFILFYCSALSSQLIRQFFFSLFILIWAADIFFLSVFLLESVRANNLFHVCHFESPPPQYAPLVFFFFCLPSLLHSFHLSVVSEVHTLIYYRIYGWFVPCQKCNGETKWLNRKERQTTNDEGGKSQKKKDTNDSKLGCYLIWIWVSSLERWLRSIINRRFDGNYVDKTKWKTLNKSLKQRVTENRQDECIEMFNFDTCWLFFNYTKFPVHTPQCLNGWKCMPGMRYIRGKC